MKKSRLKRQQLGSKAVGTLPPSPQDLAEMIENRLIQSPSKVLPMFFQSSSKVLSKFSQSSPKVLPKSSQGPPKVNPKSSQNPPKVVPKSSQSSPKVLPKSFFSKNLPTSSRFSNFPTALGRAYSRRTPCWEEVSCLNQDQESFLPPTKKAGERALSSNVRCTLWKCSENSSLLHMRRLNMW